MTTFNNINAGSVGRAYRKGWLAWLGANKTAFNMAQERVEKLNLSGQDLFSSLVEKGQTVEDDAQNRMNSAKEYIKPKMEKVSGKIFTTSSSNTADTQLESLTEEIARLSETVLALSEKVKAPRTRAAKKSEADSEVAA